MICSPREKNIAGQKFGKLTAIKREWGYKSHRDVYWKFDCDCGNRTIIRKSMVINGVQWTCGCHKKELMAIISKKHGRQSHELYMTWKKMLSRCNNPKEGNYNLYGGRGISVCDRWLDIENFILDMGERPKGYTLDRIDNDGNYCPENCRWASAKTQSNNRRNSKTITIAGVTYQSKSDASKKLGIAITTLNRRLKKGCDEEVLKPISKKNIRYSVGDGRMLTLNEIASECGITPSSVSRRIKRGLKGSELLQSNMQKPKPS